MTPFILFLALLGGISLPWNINSHWAEIRKAVVLAGILMVLYFPANMLRSIKYVVEANEIGLGLNSRDWTNSQTLKALNAMVLEDNTIFLTNAPDIFQYHTELKTHPLPRRINRRTGKDYGKGYDTRVRETQKVMAMNSSYYVHFNKITWRFYIPSERELMKIYNLYPLVKTNDGTIYKSRLSPAVKPLISSKTIHKAVGQYTEP
jgi:hypothetical protein